MKSLVGLENEYETFLLDVVENVAALPVFLREGVLASLHFEKECCADVKEQEQMLPGPPKIVMTKDARRL